MTDNAFLDTNLAIAYVFHINSLHLKSNKVFNEYTKLFWSDYAKKEFKIRVPKKFNNLSSFFHDLQKYLENPKKDLYSSFDLQDFAEKSYSGKHLKDVKKAIDPFWSQYFGFQSKIPFKEIQNTINICLNDLSINCGINEGRLLRIMQLTPQRTNNYSKIDNLLESFGVHESDRNIILDGHDFACFSSDPVDFVTFDDICFYGADNVELLCFSSVKSKYDFN